MTVTSSDVAAWGKLPVPTGENLVLLDRVLAAVVEHISTRYQVADPLTDTQEMAVILQASRLWRRRDTPEGVIAFDELGTVRVSALDSDVREMLTPQWGFA
jgi:hypothetical protein